MKRMGRLACVFLVGSLFFSCERKPDTLFKLLPSDDTGVTFSNTIVENDSFNVLTYEYIYNGGGVAIADFNNDGLQDVFFTGNEVGNKLYINKGGLRFQDASETAAVNVKGRWNSGVATVDINNDGWMDIFVCATMKPDSADRRAMLFVNQGANKEGLPTFVESAATYGLDDDGFNVNAAFFDYDRDGDLDLYLLVNVKLTKFPTNYRPKINDGTSPNNDRLYRNNGDGTFTDVTLHAGIIQEGFGLGLSIVDVNEDGWPDIYVSNDYMSNDILYINNKNSTFRNATSELLGHQSQFSMGNDASDINNDGLPDIMTLDMLPEINSRKKTTIGNKSYLNYINNEKYGYEYQYVRNMLQLNSGADHGIKFSEIGELAGVYQTEWSWSPLFADFDNDGNKDLLITNGFPKDITDKDFANFRQDVRNVAGIRYLVDSIPIVKIPNYGFKNKGDLTFTDVTVTWGLNTPSFSNGAAFGDLDNDGDLDYVVNNINEEAFVYENTLYGKPSSTAQAPHYLRVKLKGADKNGKGIGAKVRIWYDSGKLQYYEMEVSRGFLSSVEPAAHFGLANSALVDSLRVEWPNGKVDVVKNIKADQTLTIEEKGEGGAPGHAVKAGQLFMSAANASRLLYKNKDDDRIDFNLQRTVPHKFTQAGPGISVGDINGDGLEDIILGGASTYGTTAYLQTPTGAFVLKDGMFGDSKKLEEDEGLLLFDADNDNDLDLYIVSGSIESGPDSDAYQDRFFRNNGKGQFTQDKAALPVTEASGSCVRAADYDRDGDLDLFVGGRVVYGSYPSPAENYILRNDNGKFTNATIDVCPDLKLPGMVTDALWTDVDNDGQVDLMVVGEFMPVTVFKNEKGILKKLDSTGIENRKGWWNSITSGDFDRDGDMDYVVGNLGRNNNYQVSAEYPLRVYAKDFDGNGSMDPVLACYQRESMTSDTRKLYPVHFWDELFSQSPKFRQRFTSYKHYGSVTIDQVVLPEELEGALILEANFMETAYIENQGKGKFVIHALPNVVQVGPVNGLVTDDFNGDGSLDVLMVGNDFGNEVFAGRYDAFTGLVLLGNGKGGFTAVPSAESGFYVAGDAKALCKISRPKGDLWLATENRDSLKVFSSINTDNRLEIKPGQFDQAMDVAIAGGGKQRFEFYYGSGYLSQSTRNIRIPKDAAELVIYDFKGGSRRVPVNRTAQLK